MPKSNGNCGIDSRQPTLTARPLHREAVGCRLVPTDALTRSPAGEKELAGTMDASSLSCPLMTTVQACLWRPSWRSPPGPPRTQCPRALAASLACRFYDVFADDLHLAPRSVDELPDLLDLCDAAAVGGVERLFCYDA